MALGTQIDLQAILLDLGRAYYDETGLPSVYATSLLASGPMYDVTSARNLVASYTYGSQPITGSDFTTLNNFATNLQTLSSDTATIYSNVSALFLQSEFSKLNNFIATAYNTNIRSYLNTYQYVVNTGPVYDVHGGFAQSYLNYNNNSLIFKVAEITSDGTNVTMISSPHAYRGTTGLTRMVLSSFSGPTLIIADENITTETHSGPYNSIIEYGTTGSYSFSYIQGSLSSVKTLAYPRINDAGYAASGPTGVAFGGLKFNINTQPAMRYPNSVNQFIIKATAVNDGGDRDFVLGMVKNNVLKAVYPTDVEQTQVITVAGTGSVAAIQGTSGNTLYYRPFNVISATNLQAGEVFEIWVMQ